MKFKEEEQPFVPVTITLETEKEVQVLGAVLARVAATQIDDDLISNLYGHLTRTSNYSGHYRATAQNNVVYIEKA